MPVLHHHLNRCRRPAALPCLAALIFGLLTLPATASGQAEDSPRPGEPVPTAYAADPGLRTAVEAFTTDYNSLRGFYTLRGSSERAERLREFLEKWQAALEEMDYAGLDQPARIDFLLLRNHVRHELRSLGHEEERLEAMRPLIPFAEPLVALEEARTRMEPVDSREAAATLEQAIRQINETRRRVEATQGARRRGQEGPATAPALQPATRPEDEGEISVEPSVALRAATQVSAVRRAVRSWHENNARFKPDFDWWVGEPYARLDKALEEYAKFLRERVAGVRGEDDDPLIGDPIGRQALQDDIEAEMLHYSAEELVRIGERELAWCRREMIRAAEEMGFTEENGGWRAALEQVKGMYVEPGRQEAMVRELAEEAIDFLDERDLVSIPPLARETWQLDMLDSRRQRVLPFAAYGGQRMLVAFATADMDHDRKIQSMRGNNVPFTRIVTPHELIPGHHLQGYMAQRWRPWRRIFSTPFYVEGWCLHWEMLLWDLDYARTPEERIGMLFWRKHRAARIIVSLNFQLDEMTPPEMIDFLVEQVGHERDNATAEVRRFIGGDYSPLYQVAYLVGGIQIRSLYRELVEEGEMSPRQFHDAVLQQNSIPIAMVRAALLELPLEEAEIPEWRFGE